MQLKKEGFMKNSNENVKIFLKLVCEDGYPPVSTESVWAKKISPGTYKIDNIPFYSKEVCLGDDIGAISGYDGEAIFQRIKKPSQNSTIRIIFFETKENCIKDIIDHLSELGCSWEGNGKRFFAINIPIEVDLDVVLNYINYFSEAGLLDYEYGLLRQ
jgi:hypothetical protein